MYKIKENLSETICALYPLKIDQAGIFLLLIESVFGLILDMAGLAQSSDGSSTSGRKKNETVSVHGERRGHFVRSMLVTIAYLWLPGLSPEASLGRQGRMAVTPWKHSSCAS